MLLPCSMTECWCWQRGRGLPQWLSWYRPFCPTRTKRGGFVYSTPAGRTMTSSWREKSGSGSSSGTFLLSLCSARYCTEMFCLWTEHSWLRREHFQFTFSLMQCIYCGQSEVFSISEPKIRQKNVPPTKLNIVDSKVSKSEIMTLVLSWQRSVSVIHTL